VSSRYRSVSPLSSRNGPTWASWTSRLRLDRVPGGLGGVLTAGWGGPPEGTVRELVDVPAGVLLEPMVVAALRTAITQTRAATRLVGGVVLEVAGGGGAPGSGRRRINSAAAASFRAAMCASNRSHAHSTPISSSSETLSYRSSSPAAASASIARSGQPGITSSASPVPNAAARLEDSPGNRRADPRPRAPPRSSGPGG